jgi:hypothetical protein
MADDTTQTGQTEAVSQLQNIARQLSIWSQSISNASPAATTTTSPRFTAVQLSTSATAVIGTSLLRHGMLFHNPGTANLYLYQTGMTSAPTTTVLAGSVVIYPGGTFTLPSPMFPNISAGFSGFSGTGSSQALTVIEFF